MKVSEIKVFYSNTNPEKVKITQSKNVYDLILKHWNMDTIEFQEEVKVVLLNRANVVLGIYELSRGGVSQSTVDIKIILSVALKCNSSSIVLIHNHPSGSLVPSESDNILTEKLKSACETVDLFLLDHLIISQNGYYSYGDKGVL